MWKEIQQTRAQVSGTSPEPDGEVGEETILKPDGEVGEETILKSTAATRQHMRFWHGREAANGAIRCLVRGAARGSFHRMAHGHPFLIDCGTASQANLPNDTCSALMMNKEINLSQSAQMRCRTGCY